MRTTTRQQNGRTAAPTQPAVQAPHAQEEHLDVVPGKINGIKRLSKKTLAATPVQKKYIPAEPGEYTAVVCVAIANTAYDKSVPVHQQHQSPCTHLFPGDIFDVPEALPEAEAGGLLAQGWIRPTSEDDRLQHEIADAEYTDNRRYSEKTTLGGLPREHYTAPPRRG